MAQQFHPSGTQYNIITTFTIDGPLEPSRMRQAFATLVAHTDALRLTFHVVDGVPKQRINNSMPANMPLIDLSAEPNPDDAAEMWMQTQKSQGFDLAQCLFSAALLKLNTQRYIWYWNVHHLISDGYSIYQTFERLSMLYQQTRSDDNAATPPSFPQYISFLQDEIEYQQSEQFTTDEAYWGEKLAKPVGSISFYGRKGDRNNDKFRKLTLPLGKNRTRSLLKLTESPAFEHPNPNVARLNLFGGLCAALLYYITGQKTITMGNPVANRRPAEKKTIGLFMKMVALRVTIDPEETLTTLIQKVATETEQSYRHRRYTIINRQNRAYGVIYNFRVEPFPNFNGLPTRPDLRDSAVSAIKLSIQILDYGNDDFVLQLDAATDVFDDTLQRTAMEHFVNLLDTAIDNPDHRLTHLDLITPAVREQVLHTFNHRTTLPLPTQTWSQMVAAQAAKTPQAPAISHQHLTFSYRRLNQQANQVAHHLIDYGITPGTPVALAVEKSPLAIVCLLGILKAGGVYLPLSPSQPADRLALILQDSGASLVLTTTDLIGQFNRDAVDIQTLDTLRLNDYPNTEPARNLNPDAPAYIIYTSGSTGTPKGVVISHNALAHFATAARHDYGIQATDRVLQFAALSFDASLEEIAPTLISGAALQLRTPEMLISVDDFLQKCEAWHLTVLDLPTSFWHQLTETILRNNLALPTDLRLLIIGGEAALPGQVNRWQQIDGSERIRLLNTYGPTETTVVATWADLSNQTIPTHQPVPIGQPLSNVQTYILNAAQQPTPIGISGELYIGGAGVALGYHQRPDLNAAKFITAPVHLQTTSPRLFKTGDLARYDADGDIIFLGRADRQIKIRGYRVELDEIEIILAQHPAIEIAVIAARTDQNSTLRLVAYVQLNQQTDVADIQKFLKSRLPAYMIPGLFVMLDNMPLTISGKIDRNALPEPDWSRSKTPVAQFIAPRNDTEQRLQHIWQKVLTPENISVNDDFFDLGGDSLLAMRLFTDIEKEFGRKLPLTILYQASTITAMANALDNQSSVSNSQANTILIPIQTAGQNLPFFYLGGGLALINLSRALGQNQPLYRLNLDDARLTTVEAMAAHSIAAIQQVQAQGPYYLGGFCFGGKVAYEMARQLHAQGQETALLVMIETYPPGGYKRAALSPWQKILSNNRDTWQTWQSLAGQERRLLLYEISRENWRSLVWNKIWKITYRLYRTKNRSLPDFMHNPDGYYALANRTYTFQPYLGNALLLYGHKRIEHESYAPQMGWGNLVQGQIDIHQFNAHHRDLRDFKAPLVHQIAKILQTHLRETL